MDMRRANAAREQDRPSLSAPAGLFALMRAAKGPRSLQSENLPAMYSLPLSCGGGFVAP
jgi:hypothetical protein